MGEGTGTGTHMRAAVLISANHMEVLEVPMPACPEDGLRLRVETCGICGSDIRAFRGQKQLHVPHVLSGQTLRGHIIGHEIVGVVESTGPRVDKFSEGQRVAVAPSLTCGTCDACRRGQSPLCRNYAALGWALPGGFAEFVAVPGCLLADGSVNPIPHSLPSWKASLTEPLACALHGQTALNIGPRDDVLVVGGGPMGSLHVLLARQRGANLVVLIDPNECRRQFALTLKADLALDSLADEAQKPLLTPTEGRGYTAVIFAASSITAIRQIFQPSSSGWYPLLAPGARVNIFSGLEPGDTIFSADARAIFYQGVSIVGSVNSAPHHNREALELISSGVLDVSSIVTARVPLESIVTAFEMAMSRPRVHQKIIVEPRIG